MPIFANPAGLWVLLGVPAILAIHFLQQRARVVRTSTWFLIERLAPDSARGRTWDRLRSSRTLWFQLLAVLVAAWLLGEPRWVRAESAQTVVLVLDASASMDAFRAPAIAGAEREMALADGLAARTTWVVMTTNPRQPPLYRGLSRALAAEALTRWQPELGAHDLAPALRLARGLAGASGRTLLITDTRAKVPPDQRAAGVGRPIENVGFAGASVTREGPAYTWRALVKNHSPTAQQRTWHLESGGTASSEQSLSLAPGAIAEISARLPDGVLQATVVLSGDAFAADDRLAIVRPAPKPLSVVVDGNDEPAEFFRKLAGNVDGVTVIGGTAPSPNVSADPAAAPATSTAAAPNPRATLRLARVSADELTRESRGGIFWPTADQRAQAPLMSEPVTPERDALVAGLNWQGWFGTGPYGFAPAPGDTVLLWQGKWPLVWLRDYERAPVAPAASTVPKPALPAAPGATARARKLVLAFDWATSNASRLPSTVLLGRRFLEAERDAQPASYTANFDCGAPVALTGFALDQPVTVAFESATAPAAAPPEVRSVAPVELTELRAPRRVGFFTVRRGEGLLVRGATQFADPRQGDFRAAETFFIRLRGEREAAIERNTVGDPFAIGWLILLAALALGSWWTRGSARASGVSEAATAATTGRAPA